MAVSLAQYTKQRASWAPQPQSPPPATWEQQGTLPGRDFCTGYYMPPLVRTTCQSASVEAVYSTEWTSSDLVTEPSDSPHDILSSPSTRSSLRGPPLAFRSRHSSSSSIEPDPLPPHSNPQALTSSQRTAFVALGYLSPVRISKDGVSSTENNTVEYAIVREAKHLPFLVSTKPLLTVRRTSDFSVVGQIKFQALSTSSIEMTLRDAGTILNHSYSLRHHQRWGFASRSSPSETWYWKEDRSSRGAVLVDSKHRHAKRLARLKGDLLRFEDGQLSSEKYDEIVMSAIAMVEMARRVGKRRDIVGFEAAAA